MRNFKDLSDKELVEMINQGHHEAFLEVYHRYKGVLSHHLLKVLKVQELAEEVLQDVFMMLWEKRLYLDADQSVSGYLYKASINKTKNIFRQLATDQRMREDFLRNLERSSHSSVHQLLEEKEVKKTLYALLDRLPAQQKKVYVLCKLEGLSYREVSEKLQITETTVNSHIRNANKLIQQEIRKKQDLSSVLYIGLIICLF